MDLRSGSKKSNESHSVFIQMQMPNSTVRINFKFHSSGHVVVETNIDITLANNRCFDLFLAEFIIYWCICLCAYQFTTYLVQSISNYINNRYLI